MNHYNRSDFKHQNIVITANDRGTKITSGSNNVIAVPVMMVTNNGLTKGEKRSSWRKCTRVRRKDVEEIYVACPKKFKACDLLRM